MDQPTPSAAEAPRAFSFIHMWVLVIGTALVKKASSFHYQGRIPVRPSTRAMKRSRMTREERTYKFADVLRRMDTERNLARIGG